ncbi:MAG TPA: alpha/beta fold hydrolase [Kineosporiaceae bacterium]|nr:alpha/beta fold hydrolase [Kineosporiaceae bacterium]
MSRSDELVRSIRQAPVVHLLRAGSTGSAGPIGSVVVVHPGALPAKVHATLAAALPDEVGVLVLDLQGLPEYAGAAMAGGAVGDASVTTIADRLVTELHAALPADHPYVLVGWSFGGVVAHQMTCSPALFRAPERLVLLDSISAGEGYSATVESLGDEVALTWFEMYLGAKRPRPDAVREPRPPQTLTEVLERGLRAGTLRPGTSIDGLRKAYSVFVDGLRRNTFLSNPHHPARSHVPTSVIRAEGSLLAELGTLGYADLVPPRVELHTVPGDHYSMLDDPIAVAVVSSICSRYLEIPTGAGPHGVNLERLP